MPLVVFSGMLPVLVSEGTDVGVDAVTLVVRVEGVSVCFLVVCEVEVSIFVDSVLELVVATVAKDDESDVGMVKLEVLARNAHPGTSHRLIHTSSHSTNLGERILM